MWRTLKAQRLQCGRKFGFRVIEPCQRIPGRLAIGILRQHFLCAFCEQSGASEFGCDCSVSLIKPRFELRSMRSSAPLLCGFRGKRFADGTCKAADHSPAPAAMAKIFVIGESNRQTGAAIAARAVATITAEIGIASCF